MSISDPTRQAVRGRASYLCEYCHSPERLKYNVEVPVRSTQLRNITWAIGRYDISMGILDRSCTQINTCMAQVVCGAVV